jgi:hypothetical protein
MAETCRRVVFVDILQFYCVRMLVCASTVRILVCASTVRTVNNIKQR